MQLFEFTTFEGEADETNVFRNVKLLGLKSKNGYTYDPKAIEKAVPLYENAPVYVNHNKPKPWDRSYADRIGFIQNPRIHESELYGDFCLNPKHPLAEQVVWDAKHCVTGVGFSHSVHAGLNKKTNTVESIDKCYSVDLVAGPATVTTMFESIQEQESILESVQKENEALKTQLNEIVQQVNELKSALSNVTKTKPQAIVPTAVDTVKDSYGDFLKKIKR